MAHWLTPLLSPRSIAIVGASERPGSIAASTHRLLRESGFAGPVYPVNPKYDRLHDDTCYPGLRELPVVPDLVVYAISGLALERSFDDAMALGVGGVLIYAANRIEGEAEPRLGERLRAKARAAGIPVCGGNSMGFYNYDQGVMVSFDSPPRGRPPGHIGLVAHSGSGMTYLANNDARFCFNYVIASAQETHATVADYVDYLLAQPSTRVIALLLESVRDPAAFVAALEAADRRDIPVVITRLGRSEQGARMAVSHSGAIVGDYAAFAALCRRHRAILCRDADEMIVTAMLFAAGLRARGGALASMLDSGGMREQMIDLAEDYGVPFARIGQATTGVLAANLEPGLDPVNPMDGMGALGRNTRQTYLECGKALLDDPASGALTLEFEFRDGFSHYPELFDVARELAAHNDKPLVLINSCAFTSLADTAAELTRDGIPVINGIDVALRALRNLLAYRPRVAAAPAEASAFDAARLAAWRERLAAGAELGEADALDLMVDFGLPVVERHRVDDAAAARAAADALGYPVVLKTAMPAIAHKSEAGGVRLNLADGDAVEAAYADLAERLGPRALVMPMANGGAEAALGMKRDAQFGPLVILACGGVLIELLGERACRLAPVDAAGAGEMIDELRLARLLAGYRGAPPLDRAALTEAIVRFSQLVQVLGDSLAEVDLNPVLVGRDGCRIVDALVVAATK